MKATETIRAALETSRDWALTLARDLKDKPLAYPTPNGGNHALWVMGHAACSEAGLIGMITGERDEVHRWDALFDANSEPSSDASVYPPFEAVLSAFERLRAKTLALLDGLDEADLSKPAAHVPEELRRDAHFGTVGRVLLFTEVHQMSHFGQLADVRRALGRRPLVR
jgi:hypothetical protein